MTNLNALCAPLKIRPFERDALCELHLSDRREFRAVQVRPVALTLRNQAFEATYLASYEDLEAIRDWASKAMAAIEAHNEEAVA